MGPSVKVGVNVVRRGLRFVPGIRMVQGVQLRHAGVEGSDFPVDLELQREESVVAEPAESLR